MMEKNPLPSPETIKRLLDYDRETGELTWRARTPGMFPSADGYSSRLCAIWNAKFAGKPAGTKRSWYLGVRLGDRIFYAQRVIWKMVFGEEPDEVDHINGDPLDNRITNLRSVTTATNRRNRIAQRNNTSGYPGVRWYARSGRWQARYCQKHLGTFDSFDAAVAARKAEEARIGHIHRG